MTQDTPGNFPANNVFEWKQNLTWKSFKWVLNCFLTNMWPFAASKLACAPPKEQEAAREGNTGQYLKDPVFLDFRNITDFFSVSNPNSTAQSKLIAIPQPQIWSTDCRIVQTDWTDEWKNCNSELSENEYYTDVNSSTVQALHCNVESLTFFSK